MVRVPVGEQHASQQCHGRKAGESEGNVEEDRAPRVHLAGSAARGFRSGWPEGHLGVLVRADPGEARRGDEAVSYRIPLRARQAARLWPAAAAVCEIEEDPVLKAG
jgi:hypothetical protein